MANVAAVAAPNSILFATTALPLAGNIRTFKIAFRGFEDPEHWIFAMKTVPSFLFRHRYTQITLNLDEVEEPVWLLEQDLLDHFIETPSEVRSVLQYFPDLLLSKLYSLIPACTNDHLSKRDVQRMIILGMRHAKGAELQCIRKQAARTVIAGQGQSYILFSKCNKLKDKVIGSGSVKRVKLALGIENGQIYAAGICRHEFLEPDDWELISNEVNLLQELRGIAGVLQLETAIEHDNKFYILTEYFNCGDLQRVFDEQRKFTFIEKLNIASQMALGVLNMHYLNILHRDLKPSNIFIAIENGGREIRITKSAIGDLGSACKKNERRLMGKRTGTLAYIAPEKHASLADLSKTPEWVMYSTPQADIWSLGMIFFSLFNPQQGALMDFQTDKDIDSRITHLSDEEILLEIENSRIHPGIRGLLKRMLQIEYQRRCPALEVYKQLEKISQETPRDPCEEKMPPEKGASDT